MRTAVAGCIVYVPYVGVRGTRSRTQLTGNGCASGMNERSFRFFIYTYISELRRLYNKRVGVRNKSLL